jgi:hypothetical protein
MGKSSLIRNETELTLQPTGVVEDAKKLPREHLHRSQAVRSTYNGKYRPLHHQILEATIDRAIEKEQQEKTSSRPPTPIAFVSYPHLTL